MTELKAYTVAEVKALPPPENIAMESGFGFSNLRTIMRGGTFGLLYPRLFVVAECNLVQHLQPHA
jgi:hypothetical protein